MIPPAFFHCKGKFSVHIKNVPIASFASIILAESSFPRESAVPCSILQSRYDYDEAARRFELLVNDSEQLEISDAHMITNFITEMKMSGIMLTDCMSKLVSIVKEQGFDITETDQGIVWNNNHRRPK